FVFFFSSRRRHTRCLSDWSSDVCSSDLARRSPPARPASLPSPFWEAMQNGSPAPARLALVRLPFLAAAHPQTAGSPPDTVSNLPDRKSTRLNSSHLGISYAVFCLKKKTT